MSGLWFRESGPNHRQGMESPLPAEGLMTPTAPSAVGVCPRRILMFRHTHGRLVGASRQRTWERVMKKMDRSSIEDSRPDEKPRFGCAGKKGVKHGWLA